MTGQKSNVVYSEHVQKVDARTGEVTCEENRKIVRLPKEPPYVKMYLDDLAAILDLPKGCKDLLYSLIHQMNYEGIITVTKSTRERIAGRIGVKEPAVRNQMTKLCQKGVLKRIGTGEYEANPHLFAKGEWIDIRKRRNNFELKITYKNGKKVMSGRAIP